MKKLVYLPICLLIISALLACTKQATFTEKCIPPSTNFAYKASSVGIENYPQEDIIPPPPWIAEADIPFSAPKLLAVRIAQRGETEIWISGNSQEENSRYLSEISVYQTETRKWSTVSLEKGLDAFRPVLSMYVSADNSVWAFHDADSVTPPVPILSKYDEESLSFRFVDAIRNIPNGSYISEQTRYSNQVLLDAKGVFWILAPNDFIYSFDIHTEDVKRHAFISEIIPSDATLAPDGSIYILDKSSRENRLFHYFPKENEVQSVYYRLEPQPLIQNLLVDHAGNLWTGGLGWMETNGIWYQILRSPLFVTTKLDLDGGPVVIRWQQPSILLESSDHMLWFVSPNGMFSLDPQKGAWCWFSTFPSNIIEDSDHNLWMIADGKLYKLPLSK